MTTMTIVTTMTAMRTGVEYDEHIWTSPRIAIGLCRAIAETLQKADPEHAQNYARRLETYLAELSELDQAFTEVVAGENRHMVVFGDRFPLLYFCKTYGLEYRAALPRLCRGYGAVAGYPEISH